MCALPVASDFSIAANPSLRADGREDAEANLHANNPDNAAPTLNHVAEDKLQDMIDTNFQFYKQITDDPEFAKHLFDFLFARYRKRTAQEHVAEPRQ